MASRRCFSEKVTESDTFYSLTPNAQALYYHLCMAADDDGFLNNARMIAKRIQRGAAALELLINKGFLLRFGEVMVVKHWRISNSLKNDRYKDPAYPDIAKALWIDTNRAYLSEPNAGCPTLYQSKTGIQAESKGNPDGILKEEKRIEQKRIEENRTEENKTRRSAPEEMGDVYFDQIYDLYPIQRRGSRETAWRAYAASVPRERRSEALENLRRWLDSEQWQKDSGQYVPNLTRWINQRLWETIPPMPRLPTGASGRLGEAEREAIQRVLQEEIKPLPEDWGAFG